MQRALWHKIAESQLGLVTRAQLLECGVSAKAVRTALATGELRRVHRGVYAVGGAQQTDDQRRLAAVLAVGRSALGARSSAITWGAERVVEPRPELVVPVGSSTRCSGVTIRRTRDLLKSDVITHGPYPRIVRPAMTIIHLADLSEIDDPELERIGADLLLRWPKERARLKETLSRLDHRGRRGPRRVEAIFGESLATGRRPPHRGLHLDLLDAIRACDQLPDPVAQYEVKTSIGRLEVDCAWPQVRLAVEADSARWHSTQERIENDKRRDQALGEVGWLVLRVTNKQLRTEPRALLARIAAAHAARLAP